MSSPVKRTIYYGGEYMKLHEDGSISRPKIGMGPSGQWKVTGAMCLNENGRGVEKVYSLKEILADPKAIPWKFEKGKRRGEQRTFINDLDHGTHRQWRNPKHNVF